MDSRYSGLRISALLVAALLALGAASGRAAPTVQALDGAGWRELAAQPRGPQIVVFSASYCVHCPGVIRALLRDRARYGKGIAVVTVLMDGPPAAVKPPYDRVDRLYAVADEQAVRHAVNPEWRGLTPYVVLLAPGRPARHRVGAPDAADLRAAFGP